MNTGVKAVATSVLGFVYFGVLLFAPAGTFNYWQAWVFIALFTATTAGPSIYWAVKRPEVLRRRMSAGPLAEVRPAQKVIVTGVYLLASAMFVVSRVHHRLVPGVW